MHDQENISKVTSQFHHDQLQGMAGPAGAAAVLGAFALHDRMKRQDAQNAANSANSAALVQQQQITNKQLFIQNCLLQGWTMDEVNEEIAAGEEIMRQRQADQQAAAALEESLGRWATFGIVVALGLGFTLFMSLASIYVFVGIPVLFLVAWHYLVRGVAARKISNGA